MQYSMQLLPVFDVHHSLQSEGVAQSQHCVQPPMSTLPFDTHEPMIPLSHVKCSHLATGMNPLLSHKHLQ